MYSTEAIVLSKRVSGEADELVSFYTRDFGKLVVKAKSSKKLTTKQGNFLHNPSVVHFNFVLARTGYILSGIMNRREYPAVLHNITASAYVSSFFALCDNIMYEGQKDEAIWDLLYRVLESADEAVKNNSNREEFWGIEKEWLISLLNILGLAPENLNLNRVNNQQQLDIYLRRLLENKLERSVEFFGMRSYGYKS